MAYYVTARKGPQTAFLAGPFCYHGDALRMVGAARHVARHRVSAREAWDVAYGTSRVKRGPLPAGLLNDDLGLPAEGIVLPDPPKKVVNRRVFLHGRGPAPAGYVACRDADCDEQSHFHPLQQLEAAA